MTRYFEKIDFDEFKKAFSEFDEDLYDSIRLPVRKTIYSAGYDFFMPFDLEIKPSEIKKIPTGIKAKYNENEFLGIYIRSSLGFKYNIRLTNQVGIIDADYFNNETNNGHIFVNLQNHSNEIVFLKKGDSFVQGIFQSYLTTDDDISSDKRTGGFGSTGK